MVLIFLVLLALVTPAWGVGPTCDQAPLLLCDASTSVSADNLQNTGKTDEYCLTYESSDDSLQWQVCSAASAAAILGFSSCMELTGTDPVYLGDGSCADPAEARVQTRLKNAATFAHLSCQLSATTGSRTVTVKARSGACGASLSDATVTCTIGPSSRTCESGANTLTTNAGDCLALSFASDGAFPTPATLQCSLERTA